MKKGKIIIIAAVALLLAGCAVYFLFFFDNTSADTIPADSVQVSYIISDEETAENVLAVTLVVENKNDFDIGMIFPQVKENDILLSEFPQGINTIAKNSRFTMDMQITYDGSADKNACVSRLCSQDYPYQFFVDAANQNGDTVAITPTVSGGNTDLQG